MCIASCYCLLHFAKKEYPQLTELDEKTKMWALLLFICFYLPLFYWHLTKEIHEADVEMSVYKRKIMPVCCCRPYFKGL